MLQILDLTHRDIIAVEVDGKLKKEDYDKVDPLIDKAVKDFDKIKLYIRLNHIDGMEPAALAEDVKTYLKHFNNLEKMAIVGKNQWEEIITKLSGPFVSGEVRYFDFPEIDSARKWIQN